MELPFWSPRYDATFDAVAAALNQNVDNGELAKLSDIRALDISNDLLHRGHSQGIAVGRGRLITSVQEKWLNKYYSGHVQIYEFPVSDGMSPSKEFKTADHTPDKTNWSHAVIEQGVLGKDVVNHQGILFPDEIGMLCPLTHGSMSDELRDPPHDGSPTDLVDRDGNRISTYWLRRSGDLGDIAHADEKRAELGAPALIVFNNRLYLLAVRHSFIYVYELHWFGGANAGAHVVWQQLVAINTHNESVTTQGPSGEFKNFPNYDAANLLLTDEGNVFLLGSHEEWLDTWHLGQLNPPKPQEPTLTKVAVMAQNWSGKLSKNDLFGEGCAIARMPGAARKTVGFWALPHDYRHSNCDEVVGFNMCADVYTWERTFA